MKLIFPLWGEGKKEEALLFSILSCYVSFATESLQAWDITGRFTQPSFVR
jgi:hypothetical protein